MLVFVFLSDLLYSFILLNFQAQLYQVCVSVYSLVKYLKVKVVHSFNLVLVIQSVVFYCRHRMLVAEL